ncbi:MAG: HDIG domain-containing protein [Bacteroidetes bacterium]|nr:HDIG domain-containing protein [Bacteroidota bacterium]
MRRLLNIDYSRFLPFLRRLVCIKTGIFIFLIILTTLAFEQGNRPETLNSVGMQWDKETLVAPFEFPIYKSEDSLRAEKLRLRNSIEPIFYAFPNAWLQTRDVIDSLSISLDQAFSAYTDYLFGARRDSLAAGNDPDLTSLSQTTIADSLSFIDLRLQTSIRMTDSEWRRLGWDYARRNPGIRTGAVLELESPPLYERILNAIASRSQRLQLQGVLDVPQDSLYAPFFIVRDTVEQTFTRLSSSDAVTQLDARDRIQVWLEETILQQDVMLTEETIAHLIESVFTPSVIYQPEPTLQRFREAEAQVLPVRGIVTEGEEIVRNGEQITPEIKQKLDSLQREIGSDITEPLGIFQLLGQFLLAVTIISIFTLFLKNSRPLIYRSIRSIIVLSGLYAGIVIILGAVIRLAPPEFMYAVPVVLVSVLLTVIFDSRLALLSTLTIGLIGGFLLHLDFTYTWATIIGGAIAIVSARGLRNRGQLFLTAVYAFGGYVLAHMTIWLYEGGAWVELQELFLYSGIASFLLVTAYPFLWLLERGFDVTTDLRLLELSDTNHPLLRELMKRAPGTCNHSIQVSSLAGSVADEIGANTLLTRVGALYHDVGKLSSPEYFIENQMGSHNLHDDLSPSESAQIIISHVLEGTELAAKYRLPSDVVHLIESHHGTTRTEYFYQKALEQSLDQETELQEDVFRYPGPQPNSKEAGILMLVDTVEAASRTMQEASSEKLQDLIESLIDHKIADHQLDNTGLTFRDISKIKKVLLDQLLAIHHVRVSYPSDTDSEDVL